MRMMMKTKNKINELGRLGKQFKTIETKELNYSPDSRTISGYGAVFNNIDKSGDMLLKGCFAKSISDRGPESQANDKIIFLWMHNMNEPIGRITVLQEDDKGLYFEAVIDNVPRGDQAVEQLKSGTLNQFSIGYNYVWDKCEYDANIDAFIVKEVVLYEISVVSIGCNGETEFLGFKGEGTEDPVSAFRSEISALCKDMPLHQAEQVQYLIKKAISLSSIKPEIPLDDKKADDNNKVTYFSNLKLK